MKRLAWIVCLGVLVACGSDGDDGSEVVPVPTTPPADTTTDTTDTTNPVIARINSLTDCEALQDEFDQAAENNEREDPGTPTFELTTSYMEAADTRMAEIGCYD